MKESRPNSLVPLLTLATLLAVVAPAAAYNDQQHQGMTAIGYKTMVEAALEAGCNPPIDFAGATVSERLVDFPGASACPGETDATCRAEWADFLRESERAMRYLRGVDAGLPHDDTCPVNLPNAGALGQVPFAVNPGYARGADCHDGVSFVLNQDPGEKVRRCSAPALLCNVRSIYQFIGPEDHTGDLLGYWTTEADHDVSVSGIGFKPLLPGGTTMQTIDEIAEDVVTAGLIPIVCAFEALFGGDDCVDDAESLGDAAVPIDDIAGALPVLFTRHDSDFTGLWHYVDMFDPYSPCDDRRGILYERAGPDLIPDALDLLIVIGTDLAQMTVDYNESTGPKRFNITNPGDGDQPSCDRGKGDWEIATMGHTVFSPVDNLALFGWREFNLAGGARVAKSLGWPLHAIGDAVAPHHVVGTTGWGHRPYEDSAEQNWSSILFQDLATTDQVRVQQYLQLRRILQQGFGYWRTINALRATHPSGPGVNAIPIRAFVTQVASDTYDAVTLVGGLPGWPFDAALSVPYFIDAIGSRQATIDHYKTDVMVSNERALLEQGAGASVAFLTAIGQLGPPFAPAPRCGSGDALFPECGASSACAGQCCIAAVSNCPDPCARAGCEAGKFCKSTCGTGKACDATGCCVVTACDEPCTDFNDCSPGSACQAGCCGPNVR